jgi:hypothetical protein
MKLKVADDTLEFIKGEIRQQKTMADHYAHSYANKSESDDQIAYKKHVHAIEILEKMLTKVSHCLYSIDQKIPDEAADSVPKR